MIFYVPPPRGADTSTKFEDFEPCDKTFVIIGPDWFDLNNQFKFSIESGTISFKPVKTQINPGVLFLFFCFISKNVL